MKLWKDTALQSPQPFANNPELTSEQATQALRRARSSSSEVVYMMLDGAIPQLHQAVDAYRFKGLPPEEVEKSLAEVIGLVRSVLHR
jgi:hypothetical protein